MKTGEQKASAPFARPFSLSQFRYGIDSAIWISTCALVDPSDDDRW